MPVNTLTLEKLRLLNNTPENLTKRVVFDLLSGHGWRQIEVRRILASDVNSLIDGLICCRGKERDEMSPLLPETEKMLRELTEGLSPEENIIRSRRIRNGKTQPPGEDRISQLIDRLYARANIEGFKGHDLRRTFAILVAEASCDEFMGVYGYAIVTDKVPGQNDRYINYPLVKLREALIKFSPIRQIVEKETSPDIGLASHLVETGEGSSPCYHTVTSLLKQKRALAVVFY